MPDWDIELSLTLGKNNVITHRVVVEDVEKQVEAQLLGIEECLAWAKEPDSPVPIEAYNYWTKCRREGGMPYDWLTELQSQWNLTFTCMTHIDAPVAAAQPEARSNERASPHAPNGRASIPVEHTTQDLVGMLKQRYAWLMEQDRQIHAEMALLAQFMMKPKRKYERHNNRTKPNKPQVFQGTGNVSTIQQSERAEGDARRSKSAIGEAAQRSWEPLPPQG